MIVPSPSGGAPSTARAKCWRTFVLSSLLFPVPSRQTTRRFRVDMTSCLPCAARRARRVSTRYAARTLRVGRGSDTTHTDRALQHRLTQIRYRQSDLSGADVEPLRVCDE